MFTRVLASVVGLIAVGLGLVVAIKIKGKPWKDLTSKERDQLLLYVVLFVAMPSVATVVALSLTGVI